MSVRAYLITNKVSGRRYVGITVKTLRKRWLRHCCDARNGSKWLLHQAFRKYGVGAFTIEEIGLFSTWHEAQQGERELVTRYDTFGAQGYNMTGGGDGALGYRFDQTQKEAISERTKKEGNPFFGRQHSEQTKQRIKEANSQPLSEERRRRVALGNKGKNLGRKASLEARIQMSEGRKKPILQLTLGGEVVQVHPSAIDAELMTGARRQHIYRCCRGLRKSTNGFKWKYASSDG